MSRRICLPLLSVFFALTLSCHQDATVEESQPEQNVKDPTPLRIVSLSPSATAILHDLGALSLLVGRDEFSVSPPSILTLPIVGDFATPNIEAIAALRPGLVLLDASQQSAKRALDVLTIRTLTLRMHSLSDVSAALTSVGKAIGLVEKAAAQRHALQISLRKITEKASLRNHRLKVLLVIDREPESLRNMVAAGPHSYLGELLKMVACDNVMAGASVLYPQIGAEQILQASPDVIIDVSQAAGSGQAYEIVAEVPAVTNHHVYIVKDESLRAPSPRAGQALQRLFDLTTL